MPFTQQYTKLFISEESVAKTRLKPLNIYKINSYQYVDGKTKSLSGNKTAFVFCFGIHEKKLNCIKVTDINPTKFLVFLKSILKKGLKAEAFDKAETLDELCIKGDLKGSSIVGSYIKGKTIVEVSGESTYRTYLISGIKSIERMKINPSVLKEMYGIKTEKKEEAKNNPKS